VYVCVCVWLPVDGISIPYKYTSALAPIMAPNVWNNVKVAMMNML
jgi:hypothetical protein